MGMVLIGWDLCPDGISQGAFGTAERLWSPSSVTDDPNAYYNALGRLLGFRCVLARRGIPVSPLVIGSCPEEFVTGYVSPVP